MLRKRRTVVMAPAHARRIQCILDVPSPNFLSTGISVGSSSEVQLRGTVLGGEIDSIDREVDNDIGNIRC
jgi:hypothetical protein